MLNVYYMGIADRECEVTGTVRNMEGKGAESCLWRAWKKEESQPCSVFRLSRQLNFETGAVTLYFCLLPVSVLNKPEKRRKRKKWLAFLQESLNRMQILMRENGDYENGELLFSEELRRLLALKTEAETESESVLWQICLKEAVKAGGQKQLVSISLSLPEESGPLAVSRSKELLIPYLAGINYVVYVGGEGEVAWQMEDFLYQEYGILMSYAQKPKKGTIWIDFEEKRGSASDEFASANGIYHLNSAAVLKFLDTTAKNGYNTEVN